jgi:AcrR family transcriptional regulator
MNAGTKTTTQSKPAAKRPQKRGERNRARILGAAEQLFAEQGYSATSIDDVAEAVDMHQPGIFYYYPTKRALYEAVVAAALSPLDARTRQVLESSDPPEERLVSCLAVWIDELADRPTLARLILHEASGPDTSAMPAALPELGQRLQTLIERAFKDLGLDPHPDDVFHFQSVTTGASLFFVAAMRPLVPAGIEIGAEHSIERHKQLLIQSTRDLLHTLREKRR